MYIIVLTFYHILARANGVIILKSQSSNNAKTNTTLLYNIHYAPLHLERHVYIYNKVLIEGDAPNTIGRVLTKIVDDATQARLIVIIMIANSQERQPHPQC